MDVFLIMLVEVSPILLIAMVVSLIIGNSWVYFKRDNYEKEVRSKKS